MKSVGALAAGLPFFRLLENSVEASPAASPLRFIALVNPHGCPYEYWQPRAPGNDTPGSGTETSFDIGFENSVLAPLQKYQDRILVLDGVSAVCCVPAGHYGYQVLLTGSQIDNTLTDQDLILPSNASLDQYLAANLGSATKLRSLALGVSVQQPGYNTVLNYGPGGSRIPVTIDPRTVWNSLFSGLAVGAPDPTALAKQASQKSVLDYAMGTLSSLQPRLGATEKLKLQQHIQALADLEKQIAAVPQMACSPPAQPTGPWASLPYLDFESEGDVFDAGQYYPQLIDIMSDLVAQAFACDLTRFATLRIGISGDAFPMPWLGPDLDTDTHNNIAHQYNAFSYDAVSQSFAKLENWYAQRVAYLMAALDAIPEGDGTVLDHTIIFWSTEMGNPAGHDSRNLPIVLAGGGNKAFRMGRYLQFPTVRDDLPDGCVNGQPTACVGMTAHNHLLVSIAQAFGMQIDTFGWDGVSGPLPGLV